MRPAGRLSTGSTGVRADLEEDESADRRRPVNVSDKWRHLTSLDGGPRADDGVLIAGGNASIADPHGGIPTRTTDVT